MIRTTTSLVEVRVIAEDSHGVPIADLRKSDFRIEDNGQPQPITLFSAYRGAIAPTAPARPAPADADSKPTPSEYAVILLDWMNCSYGRRIFVRDEVLRLLRNYEPRQRVALFVLSRNNPRLLSDFTYNRDALIYMVEKLDLDFDDQLGPAHPEPIGGRGGRGGAPEITPAREIALMHQRTQLVQTSNTFEKIADHLLHVPGRKTLIWVSSGIPMTIDASYYAPFLEPAFGRLNRSDTAVYAISALGFTGNLNNLLYDSLYEFAHRTGGVAWVETDDLAESMRQALEDTAVSYTLGFHMPEGAKPGLHRLTVRVARRGSKLRYRESYDPTAGPATVR